MTTLTLPLVAGRKYVRRDGSVATVQCTTPTGGTWFDTGSAVSTETGRATHSSGEHPHDIVADYVGHPHAASMALYAQDAAETDKPWERWECRHPMFAGWRSVKAGNLGWDPEAEYRRKPRTIQIGEFDVPEPLREAPAIGATAWYVTLNDIKTFEPLVHYANDSFFQRALERGLLHATREAAELHAKALLSFTQS